MAAPAPPISIAPSAPISIAPPMAYAGPAPAPARPMRSEPSLSMPMVARRPWGLIALVLVIDVALAAAGAWMLSQGIGDAEHPVAHSTN